jgi:hypothetical protein
VEDSDGYWYYDVIGPITLGEDYFGYYVKCKETGGAIFYTKDFDYA